jgi:acyl-homoserine lactone acylase PvdQ
MRRGTKGTFAVVAAWLAAILIAATPASAQVQPYGTNDYGGFRNVLPPAQGRNVSPTEIISYIATGAEPSHFDDQRLMYSDLVYNSPGLSAAAILQFFKDGSFGVQANDVASTISPRPGVTIIRDAGYGVPHIYGDTRADMMFGAGYAGAQDRLFFMDVARHSGRAQLSEFAGGSNKAMDASVWDNAPYTEADLQRQFDQADDLYGAEGAQLQDDVTNYVAGINQFISEALANPALLPGEYTLLGKTLEPWKVTDVIATAALIGGIFGRGGGGEVSNAEIYSAAKKRFGKVKGIRVWKDLRQANDPEAPTTVHNRRFPYQNAKKIDPKSVAIPDPGSVIAGSPDDATSITGRAAAARTASGRPATPGARQPGLLDGLLSQGGASNALLVSARESTSGHPLAVFGPQVGYYAPEILMEEDLHAPDFDARGTAFVGINLYVLLGRGQDYAWSATSAGQDIIDTFAEKLCEPGGGRPTVNSMHYIWRGQCLPIEVLDRINHITPNASDPTPAQTFHLQAQRTVHGIVTYRGTVNGKPVAFVQQRSTYMHEADSARGFADFNTPSKIRNAQEFQRAASKISFTFNWFYADDGDIAYFNSGNNPVRARRTSPEFPTWGTGKWDWRGWNPQNNTAFYTPFRSHPQAIDQDFITSWNNKQAPAFRAAEDTYGYGPIHRSQSLDDSIRARIAGGRRINLPGLIDAMEGAGTVDLRGSKVLPWMLRALKRTGVPGDLRDEFGTLATWSAGGAHRRDFNHDGFYDESRAVQLMDAWWPLLTDAIFRPTLGDNLFTKLKKMIGIDDPPSAGGSAYFSGWYAYVQKDLRRLLGRNVQQPLSRSFCGRGKTPKAKLKRCGRILASTLRLAAATPGSQLYTQSPGCFTGGSGDSQMCHDAVRFSTTGGIGVKPIPWINRPTWQQAVEIQGHRGRGATVRTRKCKKGKKRSAEAAKKKRCKKKR